MKLTVYIYQSKSSPKMCSVSTNYAPDIWEAEAYHRFKVEVDIGGEAELVALPPVLAAPVPDAGTGGGEGE